MDLSTAYDQCRLCPRECGAPRSQGRWGRCGQTDQLRVARAALHFWEEPPISGSRGSGAVFFAGCPLGCVYCQNHEISQGRAGKTVSRERLARIFLELQDKGAHNINLVTPLHFAPHVAWAVRQARRDGLELPVVCNTGGYEKPELVEALADVVDVWLTDYKYASSELAASCSAAPDYPAVAEKALAVMVAQVEQAGGRAESPDGTLRRGVVVRHLLLPEALDNTLLTLDRLWELAGNRVDLSLMNQYTPNQRCREAGGPLSHAAAADDYELALCHADDLGFERIWWQEGGTVSESFVPPFDLEGV